MTDTELADPSAPKREVSLMPLPHDIQITRNAAELCVLLYNKPMAQEPPMLIATLGRTAASALVTLANGDNALLRNLTLAFIEAFERDVTDFAATLRKAKKDTP